MQIEDIINKLEVSQIIINKTSYKSHDDVFWDVATRKDGYDYKGFAKNNVKEAFLDLLLDLKTDKRNKHE